MKVYPKTPDEVLDYGRNWDAWLAGDQLDTSTWLVDDGLTVDAHSNDLTGTTVWLSGGTLGTRYAATNRVTTVGGRTAERTFGIEIVKERYA